MKQTIAFFCVIAGSLGVAGAASASSFDQQMLELGFKDRVEQRCNSEVMEEIRRADKHMRPDELVAYAFGNADVDGPSITAPGAAVRSGNTWYHVSYACETKDEGLEIKSISYKLGGVVPREEWSAHYLVPK